MSGPTPKPRTPLGRSGVFIYYRAAEKLPESVMTPVGAPRSTRTTTVPLIELPLKVPVFRQSCVSKSNETAPAVVTEPLTTVPDRTQQGRWRSLLDQPMRSCRQSSCP